MPRKSKRRRQQVQRPIPPWEGPPASNEVDEEIRAHDGSTSVLELSFEQVQHAKLEPAPNLSSRVEELTREAGRMRHEIQFYRECFSILQRLRDDCYGLCQEIILAHYLDHDVDRLDELLLQLHRALEQSVRLETEAKRAWLEFWAIAPSAGCSGLGRDEGRDEVQGTGNWI